MNTTPSAARRARALRIARGLLGPVALVFFMFAAWRAGPALTAATAEADWMALALAVLGWTVLHALPPAIATSVAREHGTTLPYRAALRIHVLRLPARYLPGGIWHSVSRMVDFAAHGIDRHALATLVLVENAVPLGVAMVFGGLAASPRLGAVTLLPALAGAAGLVALPLVLRRQGLFGAGLGTAAYARIVAIAGVFWSGAALVFCIYWRAFPAALEASGGWLDIASVYWLSWSAGFLAVFAPQGMGVFEATAAWLFDGALAFAVATLLAAGFRAVVLAADLLAWLTGLAWRTYRVRAPQARIKRDDGGANA